MEETWRRTQRFNLIRTLYRHEMRPGVKRGDVMFTCVGVCNSDRLRCRLLRAGLCLLSRNWLNWILARG